MDQSALRGRHTIGFQHVNGIYTGQLDNESGAIGPINLPWPQSLMRTSHPHHVKVMKSDFDPEIGFNNEGTPDWGG